MRWFLSFLFVAVASGSAFGETLTPISALTGKPAAYEGHLVSISGTVSRVVERRSPERYRGHDDPYDVLVVCDRGACLNADIGFGDAPIGKGMVVALHGRFAALSRVGPYVDRNELRVDRLEGHRPRR